MPLTLIDRFHPRLRDEQQVAIDAGHLRKLEEAELLEPGQMRPLALFSLLLLVIGGAFFALLDVAAYSWQTHTSVSITGGWGLLLWFAINIASYILILPIHELVHAAFFILWGGRPYFGTKMPYALY